MDVFATHKKQCFVWDSEKAKMNQAKHGVRFELAMTVISDPFVVFEDASVDEERREAAIGQDVMRRLLYVVHLLREMDGCIRLISARPATRREMNCYEELS